MGVAGSLLVFTGFWHTFEWAMGGRNKDTLVLIPFGVVYLVLGCLIVTFTGGQSVPWIAVLLVTLGLVVVLATRKNTQVRSWVIWLFIIIDLIIAVFLLLALLTSTSK